MAASGCCARAAKHLAAMIMVAIIATCAIHALDEKPAVELWLGGDVNLGNGGRGQLQGIAGIVQNATGIVNLEGPVAERSELRTKTLQLWNSPKALSELSGLGLKVAGIANNHSADAGAAGPAQSAQRLREHGIVPAGGLAGAAFLHLNDITVAVIAHDLTHGVPANLAAELKTARARADVLVATFHVTGPPSYLPRPELRRAVEIAYQAGASVIAAHGTHAIGPVERREQAVIAWGLGNVVFACDCTQEQDAILLRVRVRRGKAVEAELIPIQAGINNQPALPSPDAQGIFDLLDAIGSSKLVREGNVARF